MTQFDLRSIGKQRTINPAITLFFLTMVVCSCNPKPTSKADQIITQRKPIQDFERNYIGTTKDEPDVVYHIKNQNGELSGFFYYLYKGIDLEIEGKASQDTLTIFEHDALENNVVKIVCKIDSNKLVGTRTNLTTKKTSTLTLSETEKTITRLPDHIVGRYKAEGNEVTCDLSIEVTKVKAKYLYNFKSSMRSLDGVVSFSRSINDSDIYIYFEGIPWYKFGGDESDTVDEEERADWISSRPNAVDGVLKENEITIQNSGYMSIYIMLYDCDVKYILLKKEKSSTLGADTVLKLSQP